MKKQAKKKIKELDIGQQIEDAIKELKFDYNKMLDQKPIDGITFNGETLTDYAGQEDTPKSRKIHYVKQYMKIIPKIMKRCPHPQNYKITKIASLLWFEVFKEWNRDNVYAQKNVQNNRKILNPDDYWHCQELIDFGQGTGLCIGMANEADSFYASRSNGLYVAIIKLHHILIQEWGPTYLEKLCEMWNNMEMANAEVFKMQRHHGTDHTVYPKKHKDCEECDKIDGDRIEYIIKYRDLNTWFFEQYRKTFTEGVNPFTGEKYKEKKG